MSHDPDRKIVLPKGTKFDDVLIKSCLTKEYPCTGPYAGGIVFKRCYAQGSGIGFTKEQCEQMWDDINLDDHTMTVDDGSDDGTHDGSDNGTHGGSGDGTHDGSGDGTHGGSDDGDHGGSGDGDHGGSGDGSGRGPDDGANGGSGDGSGVDDDDDVVLVGDCLEVWWDDEGKWFPCAVKEQRRDVDSVTVSNCRYDDSSATWWHDLDSERYRRIAPTKVRLTKLSVKNLRSRLRIEAVPYLTTDHKQALVDKLFVKLSAPVSGTESSSTASRTTTPEASTTPTTTGYRLLPGDCLEVWWDDPGAFFGCVIGEQTGDVNDTTASSCLYDDKTQRWHGLDSERYRRIAPTKVRLTKLSVKNLRARLRLETVPYLPTDRKQVLVNKLFDKLSADDGNAAVITLWLGRDLFKQIEKQEKRIDGRLIDDRVRDAKVGDILNCRISYTKVLCRRRIVRVTHYQSFRDMVANEPLHYLLPGVHTQREALQVYRDLYSKKYTPTAKAMAMEMAPLTDFVPSSSADTPRNTPEVPRAKLGYSHMERMSLRKRNREDMEKFNSERDVPIARKARRDDSYRTATEVSNV